MISEHGKQVSNADAQSHVDVSNTLIPRLGRIPISLLTHFSLHALNSFIAQVSRDLLRKHTVNYNK